MANRSYDKHVQENKREKLTMSQARTFPDGRRPNMVVIALFVVLCSVIGAVVVSVIVAALSNVMKPSWSRHTMRNLVFVLSFPIGGLTGGAFGYVWIKYETPNGTAGRMFSVVGGVNVILSLGIGFLSAESRGLSLQEFLWTIVSPWCLVPLIASSAILARGIYLLTHRSGI